jgi:hypothetical protein
MGQINHGLKLLNPWPGISVRAMEEVTNTTTYIYTPESHLEGMYHFRFKFLLHSFSKEMLQSS